MTERSRFWDGTSLGDATDAPYSAQEFSQVVLGLLGQNNTSPWQRSFISFGQGYGVGSLLVTGAATPVSIAAGIAFVAGMWYENDASTTLAIPTPAVKPRRDRVVLRADWATQTIRLARLAGAEAATPTAPALTQTFGTTWEVSLATVYVTTGGVITVTDERRGNIGLGNSVLFRDIANRWHEEWFDHFDGAVPLNANTTTPWYSLSTGGAITTIGGRTAIQISTGAGPAQEYEISRGNNNNGPRYTIELGRAPLYIETLAAVSTPLDANANYFIIELIDAVGTSYIDFGAFGATSATNLILRAAAGGAPTTFNTGQALDTGGTYHTYGLLIPAAAGPVIATYDGVVIGQVAATIPASGTDLTRTFRVTTANATARNMQIDYDRHARGA